MKRAIFLCLLLATLTGSAVAQRDNTFYAKEFEGTTVGRKVTLAQNECSSNASIPCIIIIDSTLAAFSEGTMPTRCTQCSWEDYRVTPPRYTLNGSYVVQQRTHTDVAHTGTLVETVLATYTVPAGRLGVNSVIQIKFAAQNAANAGSTRMRVRIGGAAGTALCDTVNVAANVNITVVCSIRNRNSLSAQHGVADIRIAASFVNTGHLTATQNTAASFDVVITAILVTNAADTVTLNASEFSILD